MGFKKDLDNLMCDTTRGKSMGRKKLKMSSSKRRKIDRAKTTRRRRKKGQRISKGDYKRTRV